MAYFQFGDQQLKLNPGSQRLGPDGTGADIRLPSGDAHATAIVVLNPDLSVIIKRADDGSVVLVNKVPLGAEPLPLMHGDHVEIGGQDLRFGDTAQAGSTQFVSAADLAEIAKARAQLAPMRPTLSTGGRLISLVDGREYAVGAQGLVIGRDPSADIVVATTQVSRRHVQIAPGAGGYVLTDLSTNGVWVNDERVAKTQVLGKGDIIKVADEEFRFYADAASSATPAVSAPTPVIGTPIVSERPASAAPSSAPVHLHDTPPAPSRASSTRPVLATLLVMSEGADKGKKFDVIGPLTNIGRGAHNDFVLESESVSDSHAKLQKREGGWVLVDVNSTNGTYLGGRRIGGEHPLKGAPDLRFGDVRVAFRPGSEAVDEAKSTRVMPSMDEAKKIAAARKSVDEAMRSVTPAHSPAVAPISIPEPQPEPVEAKTSTLRIWLLVLALLSAAAAYFIIGRTL
jgi:pSer/pThr/pTyr-binding forkhead associated (FHA) protein